MFLPYLTEANPTLQKLNLGEFVDNSFLKQLEQEGKTKP
jgi:hypothetical protein